MSSGKVISIIQHHILIVEDKLPFTHLMLADNGKRSRKTLENLGLCY